MIQINRSRETAADLVDSAAELIEQALSNVRQGFAPPLELYRAEYRRHVDWSQFPLWARWTDPEIYTGSCHEG